MSFRLQPPDRGWVTTDREGRLRSLTHLLSKTPTDGQETRRGHRQTKRVGRDTETSRDREVRDPGVLAQEWVGGTTTASPERFRLVWRRNEGREGREE